MKKAPKVILCILSVLFGLLIFGIGGIYGYYRYMLRGSARPDEWKIYSMNEIPVEPDDFRADFESIHKRVKKRYAYIDRKQIDMDSLHTAFVSRLDSVRTKTGYAMLLREYMAGLQAGHAQISFKARGFDPSIIVIGKRLFIHTPPRQLLEAGFEHGDEIISVDHTPVDQWIEKNEKYASASTEAYRYLQSAFKTMWSCTDSLRTYNIIRGGKELEMTIRLPLPLPSDEYRAVTWERTYPGAGYIEVREMSRNMLDSFATALEQVRDLPNLIIDARRNGGGNSDFGDSLATYLIKGERTGWNGYSLKPRKNSFRGKVFILMSTYSFSAAESFLITMKESGDATLIGEPSAGDTGGFPLAFKSDHGLYYRIPTIDRKNSPGGHPLEGCAIQPHYLVPQTIDDFLHGRDTQIEYILRTIQSESD